MDFEKIKKQNQEKTQKDKKLVLWLLPLVIIAWGLIILIESSSPEHVYTYEEQTPEGKIERALPLTVTRDARRVNKIVGIQFIEQFGGEHEGKNLLSIEFLASKPYSDTKEGVLREAFEVLGLIGKHGAQLNIGEILLKPQLPLINKYGQTKEGQVSKIVFPFIKAMKIDPEQSHNFNSLDLEKVLTEEGRNFKWLLGGA